MVVDKEFESLLPPLPEEDYKGLEESIKREGCRDPLVVWRDILVDGHNRYKICTENNIPYKITSHKFKDRGEVITWIISNQMGRRNLTPFQRSELVIRLKPILKEKAKDRQGERTDITYGRKKTDVKKPQRTDEALGKIAGVSRDTIRKTEIILESGTAEDIADVRSGKVSISGKAKEIKEREKDVEARTKQEEPAPNNPEYTEFQQQFINNSPHILRILKSIDDECRDVMSSKERKAFDRIITNIKDLQEIIGGNKDEEIKRKGQ